MHNDNSEHYDIAKLLPFGPPSEALDVPNWPMADKRGNARFRVVRDSCGREVAYRKIDGGTLKTSPSADCVKLVTGADGKLYIVGVRWINHACYGFIVPGTLRKPYHFPASKNKPLMDAIHGVMKVAYNELIERNAKSVQANVNSK